MTNEQAPTSGLPAVIDRIQREIQTLKNTAHILTPMARTNIDNVAIGKIPVLRVAAIDPDPEHGDVYLIKQINKFALTKVGLSRLEAIAGITDWKTSVAHGSKQNEEGRTVEDPLYVKVIASAEITDIDGMIRTKTRTYELNLNDGSPQAKRMIKKRPDNTLDDKELVQARQFIVQLAQAKAMNLVRRELLNLQSTFTRAELMKPFVIMRLIDAPLDASDPLVRKLIVMKQLKITSEMYDSAAASMPTPAEIPQSLPVIDIVALPEPVVQAPVAQIPESVQGDQLVNEVEELYKKKVRGGRGANKAPLSSLSTGELLQLKDLLKDRPDIA